MRLHTDLLTADELRAALVATGLSKKGVWLEVCEEKGSRSHRRAFEVRLGAEQRPGRHYTNSGKYGANTGFYAATYDEWGYWLAEVYRRDAYVKAGQYADRVDYHAQTKGFYLQEGEVPERYAMPSQEACNA